MIPLTKEAREGLTKMVAVADCGKPGLRDPKITAAMAWIDGLPDAPIELRLAVLQAGCASCPFQTHITSGLCGMVLHLGEGEKACWYDVAPPWCPLRRGPVLVVGVEA